MIVVDMGGERVFKEGGGLYEEEEQRQKRVQREGDLGGYIWKRARRGNEFPLEYISKPCQSQESSIRAENRPSLPHAQRLRTP